MHVVNFCQLAMLMLVHGGVSGGQPVTFFWFINYDTGPNYRKHTIRIINYFIIFVTYKKKDLDAHTSML